MGQVHGHVVAAAFAVFNPAVVVPSVAHGWSLTDAATIFRARDNGGIGQLVRLLGENPDGVTRARELLTRATSVLRPEGRPLFAGLIAQQMPDTLVGQVWRLGDMLREFRGDSHTAAWISAGFTACEIGVVSELYWGLPARSYSRTRGWSDDDYAVAIARLERDGLVLDDALTDRGHTVRESVEVATDAQMAPVIAALDDDLDELLAILRPWGATVRAGKGYPASGPHDLADSARK